MKHSTKGDTTMIKPHHKANFETLGAAFDAGAVCLVEARRVVDGAIVKLVCAISENGDEVNLVPFAELVDEDPYEAYLPSWADEDIN